MIQTSIVGSTASSSEESEGSEGGGFTPERGASRLLRLLPRAVGVRVVQRLRPGRGPLGRRHRVQPAVHPVAVRRDRRPGRQARRERRRRSHRSGRLRRCCSRRATTTPPPRRRTPARTSSTTRRTAAATCRSTSCPDSGHLYQVHASLAQTVDVFVQLAQLPRAATDGSQARLEALRCEWIRSDHRSPERDGRDRELRPRT